MWKSRSSPRRNDGFKRHSLSAQHPRLVLQLRGHLDLWNARPQKPQDVIEQTAATAALLLSSRSFPAPFFTERSSSTKPAGEHVARSGDAFGWAAPSSSAPALATGSLGGDQIPRQFDSRLRGQPPHRCNRRRSGHNLRLRRLHLFAGLRGIPPIRKQPRCAPSYRQRRARAGKSTKIANVGKMSDKQAGKPSPGELAAQRAHAAEVVHPLSFITLKQFNY